MPDQPTTRGRLLSVLPSRELVGVVLAALVLLYACVRAPPPGLSIEAQRTLGVFVAALLLWLTRPVPYVVSSVLAVALLFALGTVESFGAAATGFTSTLVFFLLLLLLLANTITSVGLDRQLAHRLLDADSTPRESLGSVARSVLLLAVFMPSAMARAITFIPVVKQFAAGFELGSESGFERGSFLLLGHVNPIASMALMTGGGMALVTSEVISTSVQRVTWVEWAVLMVPPTVLLYVLGTIAAAAYASVDGKTPMNGHGDESPESIGSSGSDESPESDGAVMCNESPEADGSLEPDGIEPDPFTRPQWIVTLVVAATVVAWVLGSFVGVPTILPAVLAVTVLSLPRIEIVTSADVAEVNWGIVFLIGAMLSILDVMQATGAITYLVDSLTRSVPFAVLAHWQLVLVLLAIAVGVRVLFSTGSAAIVVALPIVLEFGRAFGVNRLYLGLAVLLVVGSTTILPFNTTAVLVSMDRGPLTHRDVASFGVLTLALSLFVVAVAWLFYWPAVT